MPRNAPRPSPSNPNYTLPRSRERPGSFRSFDLRLVDPYQARLDTSSRTYEGGGGCLGCFSPRRSKVERRSIDSCHKVTSPPTTWVRFHSESHVRFCFARLCLVETHPPVLGETVDIEVLSCSSEISYGVN